MTYIGIVVTLILLIRIIEAASMASSFQRAQEYRQKQDEINEEVLYLHRELLATELEILQELKRR